MCRRYDRLAIDERATALVLGDLDVHLIRELAVSRALTANDAPLGRLDCAAAD